MKLLKPGWVNHGYTSKAKIALHAIYSLDIHPDGSRLATGGLGDNSGLVVLWNMKPIRDAQAEKDTAVPKKLFQTDSHLSCVNCVRWSPKGYYLASAGDDAIIMIWFMASGASSRATSLFGQNQQVTFSETWRCASHLRGHSGDILDLAWSQNGCYLASASVDNSVRVWTVGRWQDPPSVLTHTAGMVKGVVWDPAGRFLASQTERGVSVWRTSDWSEETRITKPFTEGAGHTQVLRLSWSPDGSNLVAPQAVNNGFPTAQIINRSHWTTPMDLVGHKKHIICARYNPNLLKPSDASSKQTSFICTALGSKDRSISIWTSDIRRPVLVVHDMFTSSVMDLAWSTCGLEFMCCSLDGSVAYFKFSEADLGRPVSKEDLIRIHRKAYGQSLLDSKDASSGTGVGLILETPEALALQEQQAKMREALEASAGEVREIKLPAGPPKQIESRTKTGRRRITPKFLGHLDEPDENSNPQFTASDSSNSMSLTRPPVIQSTTGTSSSTTNQNEALVTTSSANQKEPDTSTAAVTSATATVIGSEGKNEEVAALSGDSTVVDMDTTPSNVGNEGDEKSKTNEAGEGKSAAKSVEVTLLGTNDFSVDDSSVKDKSPKKSKHRHQKSEKEDRPRKRREKHRHRRSAGEGEENERDQQKHQRDEDEDTIVVTTSSKKRRRLQVFQEDGDSGDGRGNEANNGGPLNGEAGTVIALSEGGAAVTLSRPHLLNLLPEADMTGTGGRYSVVCDSDVLVEITNDRGPGGPGGLSMGSHHRLSASKGGHKIWEIPFTHRINAMAVSGRFICVGDMRGRLHLMTSQGSRVSPPLLLDSPLADLHCSTNHILAVTQRANVVLWSLVPLKQVMKESLELILRDASSTYKSSYLTKEGMAVIQLTSGSAFGFHLDLNSWVELFDAQDIQRYTAARSLVKIPQTGSLAAAQLLSKIPFSAPMVGTDGNSAPLEGTMKRRALQDFLECQIRCAELLESPDELRFWTTARVRQLIQDGDEHRLRQVCEDLLGPVHRSSKSAWQGQLLGLSKRDLLRDLLPLFALNLHLQRLYVELKEQLDSVVMTSSS